LAFHRIKEITIIIPVQSAVVSQGIIFYGKSSMGWHCAMPNLNILKDEINIYKIKNFQL
jgi:hypothetical protein